MKIIFIITDYGSFNNFLSELTVNLVRTGIRIDVICGRQKVIDFEDKFDYKALGINIHFLEFPRGFNLYKQVSASIKINRLIEQLDPDLIHIHFTTGIFTTLIYKKPKFKTIGTIHGLGFPQVSGIKKAIFKAVELFCFNRLDQLWLINQFDYDLMKSKNPQKVFMLLSAGIGCDLEKFNIDKFFQCNQKFKDELGIKPNEFVITYTGRFVNFKGFHLVIRAFMQLRKLNPYAYKLILIGGPDPIHKTGLNKQEELEYMNCPDIVNVGFTNNVERYLAVTDVFLFPSSKEGMPVCIIEALAMGIPTVTTNTRGCNDLVHHNENGFLLSEQPSINEIVDAITILKNSPQLLEKFKSNALKNRDKLGREIFIKTQKEVYFQLIN